MCHIVEKDIDYSPSTVEGLQRRERTDKKGERRKFYYTSKGRIRTLIRYPSIFFNLLALTNIKLNTAVPFCCITKTTVSPHLRPTLARLSNRRLARAYVFKKAMFSSHFLSFFVLRPTFVPSFSPREIIAALPFR